MIANVLCHSFVYSLTLSFPIVPTFSRVYMLVCMWCDLHKPAPCLQWGCLRKFHYGLPASRKSPDCSSGSSLVTPLKLLVPPPVFIGDTNQPPVSCLLGADSISQGAHLLQGPFIKPTGAAADLRQGRAGGGW